MRSVAVAALAFALAACGDDGSELAASNSRLTPAQVDAALGPADQSAVEDAIPPETMQNGVELAGNEAAASEEEDEQ